MHKRVLLAGLFHETHTFLEGITPVSDFQVRRRSELWEAQGDGSPLSGVLEVAESVGWKVLPVVDLRSTPSATVDDAVVNLFLQEFEAVAEEEVVRGVDGIYLVLHGAMVSQSLPDVEGYILERIRALPGLSDRPICGVLDLHGNISRRTAELTQGLIAYRRNPHTDSRAAAMDAAELLDRILTERRQPTTVWEHPPIMWPPTGTGTDDDPMRTLEIMARDIEQTCPDVVAVNVFGGFSFADTPDTGASWTAITFGEPAEARRHLRRMTEWAIANRKLGNVVAPCLSEVMPHVQAHLRRGERPVILVEPSDNIGGGAPGDGTSVLRALIAEQVHDAAVIINDPIAVRQLQAVALREQVRLSIGGRGSRLGEGPLELDVELLSRSDGRFELEDRHSHLASMSGIHINMGPSAVVAHAGIQILLTTRKTPPFDLGQLRSQGIEPESRSIIAVKAAVAHRRAYDPIARASYTVETPGPCSSQLTSLPFQRVRRPIYPLDSV